MSKAARAIIIENDKLLVMQRKKYGNEYFTLVGGRVNDNETVEQGLVREVWEETGLRVTEVRLVYVEEHPEPYNEQYIYLCRVAPHEEVAVREDSEEGVMNKYEANVHQPHWVSASAFPTLAFRTPQLHEAISTALKKGFPEGVVRL